MGIENPPICRRIVALASVAAIVAIRIASLSPSLAADDPALEQYLSRLGLTELRLTYFEQLLEREAVPAKRAELARTLANSFAEDLAASSDEPERFVRLKARAEKLLAEFPAARTPMVRAALLQADYQQAEALVIRWMENPADRKLLPEAAQTLAPIQQQLRELHAELAKADEAAAEAIDRITNETARQAAESQLKRQRTVAIQADYFAGWSAYYLGVARFQAASAEPGIGAAKRASAGGGQTEFTTAKEHFCRVLEISDEKNYSAVEADTLGLDSIWRARTVIGLGLAELGLRHIAAADHVFAWLAQGSVPPAIRDQAAYWQLQGLLNVAAFDEADKFAARQIAALSGSPSPGRSSLCVAAVHGGAARGVSGAKLVELGIRGLARMRQFDTVDKLIEKHKLDDRSNEAFTLAWLRGRRQYLAAEKDKAADGFKTAATTLAAALALPDARREALEAAQARYYLAWARFRLDELDTAARLFQEASIGLAYAAPEVAAQAAWMHCTCLLQIAAKDKRQVSSATAALESFRRDYPASEEAQQVDILVARLRQNQLPPQDAIRELAAIKPSDPGYISAQYEISQLQYQLWNKARANAVNARPLAAELLKTVDHFLALADQDREAPRRLKSALLAIDVLLSGAEPTWDRARDLLTSVAKAAAAQDLKSAAALEFQYRRLQLADHSGDAATAIAAAEEIVRHGAGTVYELPALAIAARAADEAVKAAAPAERPNKFAAAEALYTRLVSFQHSGIRSLEFT